MSKDIFVHLRIIDKFKAMIMKVIFALFVIKIFFALAGSIQEVAMFVNYNRNLVIGYLHLVFLGIVTPFFFIKIASIISNNSDIFFSFILCFTDSVTESSILCASSTINNASYFKRSRFKCWGSRKYWR